MALALLRVPIKALPLQARPFGLQNITVFRQSSTMVDLKTHVVTPIQLNEALRRNPVTKLATSPRVVPICAAWFLPNDPEGRAGRKVFEQRRIPNARFFDLDQIKDHESPYPHMLPTAETFAESMSELGIRRDDTLVVYDSYELGLFSAPRVAWTLRVFGHPQVHILNNFRVWVDEGYPTSWGPQDENKEKSKYPVPSYNMESVACYREIKSIVVDYGKEVADPIQIIDARGPGRFNGTEPEPRPGLPNGHMPGSINISLPEILDPKTKTLLPADQLKKVFEGKKLDPKQPIISSCGTGVTACALDCALAQADFGHKNDRRVYDGSWTEYAQRVKPKYIHRNT